MDTVAWISQFRKEVLNSEMNCFDELLKYGSLDEISYPNQLIKKILWGEDKISHNECNKKIMQNSKPKTPKFCSWMSKYPSLWNELRMLTHYCIKQIILGKECPRIAINALQDDALKIDDLEFQNYWYEILNALNFKPDCLNQEDTCKKPNVSEAKLLIPNSSGPRNIKLNETSNQHVEEKESNIKCNESKINHINDQFDYYNQETKLLKCKIDEMRWKIEEVENVSKLFLKNFNKLNLAYLFLRNYRILNLSEFIRKNLKIECSRPRKIYYNILNTYRIYQEEQKLVKGIIKQYKYKRRTRAMSSDDNENTIWTLTGNNKNKSEEEIANDKTNIKCLLRTAISNNNTNTILKLSIDKRIKTLSAKELEEVGYFYAMKRIQEKENELRKEKREKREEEKKNKEKEDEDEKN